MSKVSVLAKLTCKEGSRDAAAAVLAAQIELVADETGTEIYSLHADDSDNVTLWFFELYADAEALAFHGQTENMKALGPKLAGLMAARPEILRLTPIAAKGIAL